MNKKLYVGNLSYATTENELTDLFSQVGTVISAVVITDHMTGRSKGFGFVEMETEEAAQEAIQRFNDTQLDERTIKVAEARPPRDRSFGGGRRGSGGFSRDDRRRRF